VAVALAAACGGPPRLVLPSGPGEPLQGAAEIAGRVFSRCAGARTLTAEIGVSGRAGRQKLRARLIAGFAEPGSLRLEAVAPFGPPGFILVADPLEATLLLPRDDRVLTDAAPADILGALAGVSLTPDDLRLALVGCPSTAPAAVGGTRYGEDWVVLDLGEAARAYLRARGTGLEVAALVRPDLVVEYPERTVTGSPVVVRLREAGASARFDVTLRLSQVELNVPVPGEAFRVDVPDTAVSITLDELREAGPMRDVPSGGR
jgi:hypothetical protein